MKKKMAELKLKNLYQDFRDGKVLKAYSLEIKKLAQKIDKNIKIMEVCGGHTHSIMKYALPQLMPENIEFIHGPGCPVCVMPKQRIDEAYILAKQPNTILVTLGDMIKVPGTFGTLQTARSEGADVRFVYSPIEALKIAQENKNKQIVFFAIGFETTTPMTSALIEQTISKKVNNLIFHINHVRVPEVMEQLLIDNGGNQINAFLGPSHVSVITGSQIYDLFTQKYKKPVVVGGFEPVDVMESILMIVKQIIENRAENEIQYKRAVTYKGNIKAQELMNRYFEQTTFFWRGLGEVENSGLKLKNEFDFLDARKIYSKQLKNIKSNDDHKLCICGEILRGMAKPTDCKVFKKVCTPENPLGSCMVSSEGACSAYYKYFSF
jgi:hydrogenase expression/formation protein HypD